MSNRFIPFFSIVCPAYNSESSIRKCVDSVLKQDFDNWELILINDGSSDKTASICDYYVKKSNQIRVFHNENQGPYLSRIQGIKESGGDYIIFLDSDDQLEKNALAILYKHLVDNNKPDCIIFKVSEINSSGNKRKIHKNPANSGIVCGTDAILEKCFFDEIYWYLVEKVFKRDLISNIDFLTNVFGGFKLGEDTLMSYILLSNCKTLFFAPDYLYLYFRNATSLTGAKTFNQWFDCFRIYEYIYNDIFKKYKSKLIINNGWIKYYANSSYALVEAACKDMTFKRAKAVMQTVNNSPLFCKALSTTKAHTKMLLLLKIMHKRLYFLFYILVCIKAIKDKRK